MAVSQTHAVAWMYPAIFDPRFMWVLLCTVHGFTCKYAQPSSRKQEVPGTIPGSVNILSEDR